jgi:hypothetical protein
MKKIYKKRILNLQVIVLTILFLSSKAQSSYTLTPTLGNKYNPFFNFKNGIGIAAPDSSYSIKY